MRPAQRPRGPIGYHDTYANLPWPADVTDAQRAEWWTEHTRVTASLDAKRWAARASTTQHRTVAVSESARIAELEAALLPFAREFIEWHGTGAWGTMKLSHMYGEGTPAESTLTLDDLERAHKLLRRET